MKLNTKTNRKGFTLVELLVVMAIIATLASIATPLILKKTRDGDKTKAIGHAGEIKKALLGFELEHGIKPGDSIAGDINGGDAGTANGCFRMLLQGTPDLRSEAIFYAPSKLSKKPDGEVGTKPDFKKACEKGEVGFLYIDAPYAQGSAVIVAAPLQKEDGSKFDFTAYNGKAVILTVDGSVETLNIDEKTGQLTSSAYGSKEGDTGVDMLDTNLDRYGEDAKIKSIEKR